MSDVSPDAAATRFALYSDGGIYRWADLLRLFATPWATELVAHLDLTVVDVPTLGEVAERFGEELNRIDEHWQEDHDETRFHRESAQLIEATLRDLEARLGSVVAEKVLRYGATTNTGNEYQWSVLLRRLRVGGAVDAPDVTPETMRLLLRLIEEHVQPLSEAAPEVDDEIYDQALDLARVAQIDRIFRRLTSTCDPSVVNALLEWARHEVDRIGGDPTVLEIRKGWRNRS